MKHLKYINFSPYSEANGETSVEDTSAETNLTGTTNEGIFINPEGSYVNFQNEAILVDAIKDRDITINKKGEIVDSEQNILQNQKNTLSFLMGDVTSYDDFFTAKTPTNINTPTPAPVIEFKEGKYVNEQGVDLLSNYLSEEDLKDKTLDNEGNLLDTEGKIIVTKDAIIEAIGAETTSESLSDNIYTKLETETGIKPIDVQGNEIQFDVSDEGLAKYVSHIAKQSSTIANNNAVHDYLTSNPHILAAANYYKQHGTFEGSNAVDYTKVSINADTSKDTLKDIIIKASLSRDIDTDRVKALNRATRYVESIAADGDDVLQEEANAELTYVIDKQQADAKIEASKIENIKTQERNVIIKNKERVTEIVNKGKVIIDNETINIPKHIKRNVDGSIKLVTREDFVKWYSEPAYIDKDTGEVFTEYEKNTMGRTFEIKMFDALVEFAGGKKQFVDNANNTKQVNALKDLINKQNASTRSTKLKDVFGKSTQNVKTGINNIV